MFSYFSPKIKGHQVLTFDNVELTSTKSLNSKPMLIQSGPLKVLFFEDNLRFVLALNRWKYALINSLPIIASNHNTTNSYSYTIPAFEGSYTLTLSKVQHPEAVINFETILKSTGKLSYDSESTVEASSLNMSVNDVSFSTTNSTEPSRWRRTTTNVLWKGLAKASLGFIGGSSQESSHLNMVQVKSLNELKSVKGGNLPLVTFSKEEIDKAVGRSIENLNRVSHQIKNEALTTQNYVANLTEGSEQKDTFEDLLMDISDMQSFRDSQEDELNKKKAMLRKLMEDFEKERAQFLDHEKELLSLRDSRLEKIKEIDGKLKKQREDAEESLKKLMEDIDKQDKIIKELQQTIKEMLASFKFKDIRLKEIDNKVIACKKEFKHREEEIHKSVKVQKEKITEMQKQKIIKYKEIEKVREELDKITRMLMTAEAELESKKEEIRAEQERLYAKLKKRASFVERDRKDIEKLEQKLKNKIENKVQVLWKRRVEENGYKQLENKVMEMRELLRIKKIEKRELLEKGECKARENLDRREGEAEKELVRIREEKVKIENEYNERMNKIKEKKNSFSSFREYIAKECEIKRDLPIEASQRETLLKEDYVSVSNVIEQEFIDENEEEVRKKLQNIKQLEAELQAENEEMIKEHLLLQQELDELMRDYDMSDEGEYDFDDREDILVQC